MALTKPELFKHLLRVAQAASPKKRLNGVHVRAITAELLDHWARSLQEKGSASLSGFGRFDVQRGKGTIKFTPSKLWSDKIFGEVSTSAATDVEEQDEDAEDHWDRSSRSSSS